jgi:drug/metabolite transporter (DMT)-like permease
MLVMPKKLGWCGWRREARYMLAGLSGITLYYLLENVALTKTSTANTGVIVSTAPFFTAMAAAFVTREEHLRRNFFIGFLFAMAGVWVISFYGGDTGGPAGLLGDLLALGAAVVWAVYSILSREIGTWGYHPILTTRRIFVYGLLFLLPVLLLTRAQVGFERFGRGENLFNLVYLGLGASATCFVTWNKAISILGSVRTSSYIYAVPVINILGAALVLGESITAPIILGTVLTILGLVISELKEK